MSSDIFRFTQKPPSTKSSSSSLPLASTLALVRFHLLFKSGGDPVYAASAERNQIIDAINGSPINLQRRNAGGGIHYALQWCISILHISHISLNKYQWCSSDSSSLHDHASQHKRHNVLRHNHLSVTTQKGVFAAASFVSTLLLTTMMMITRLADETVATLRRF